MDDSLKNTGPMGDSLQTLSDDGELILCRGRRQGDSGGDTVLLVRPAAEFSLAASAERLAHEYALKDELDGAWAVRPLELVREPGRTMLVLEDPGGEPLGRLLGAPMEVACFLRCAAGIAAALGKLHQRGLAHKDIKPANIIVNCADGRVRLTGFGIASRLPRERQAPEPPETIAGTLAYMAPEQTGRMNRAIDSRSDLYSLGVTLLSDAHRRVAVYCGRAHGMGALPHREKAGAALRAGDRTFPAPLSRIVMKLLAKTAEERYQTAAGVESDLRRCLADGSVRAHRRLPAWRTRYSRPAADSREAVWPGARDRNAAGAFARVVESGTPELVLVSGYSGIGKSAVVNELHKALVPPRGLFASGKFDQYKRDIPYATLAQAFQSLIRPLLGKGEAELAIWRGALAGGAGPERPAHGRPRPRAEAHHR